MCKKMSCCCQLVVVSLLIQVWAHQLHAAVRAAVHVERYIILNPLYEFVIKRQSKHDIVCCLLTIP